jgi:hypothetical protein
LSRAPDDDVSHPRFVHTSGGTPALRRGRLDALLRSRVLRGNPDQLNQSWSATSLYMIGAVLVVVGVTLYANWGGLGEWLRRLIERRANHVGSWMNPLSSVPPTRAGIRRLAVAVTVVGLLCLFGGASVGG